MANFPTTQLAFAPRANGQTIYAQHLNAVQDEVSALEAALVGGSLPTPQRIAGVRPALVLTPGTPGATPARLYRADGGQIDLSHNASYDGANFNLDQVGHPGVNLAVHGPTRALYGSYFTAGANPRAQIALFQAAPNFTGERGRTTGIGDYITIAFNPGLFTAATGTWTMLAGNCSYIYTLIGKTCFVNVTIGPSTTSAVTASLTVQMPSAPAGQAQGTCLAYNGTAWSQVLWSMLTGTGFVIIYPTAAGTGTFPASANIYVRLTFAYAIP